MLVDVVLMGVEMVLLGVEGVWVGLTGVLLGGKGRLWGSMVHQTLGGPLVDHMGVVATRGAVVVPGGQVVGQRGDEILLPRHTDQT